MATAPKIAAIGHVGWWEALNPPIYLISLLPALSAYTIAPYRYVPVIPFLLGTLGVLLLQHAVNVFNDVTDWKRNADIEKPDSWVRCHRENTRIAQIHALLSVVAGALVGLLALQLADRWWLLCIAAPLVLLGLLYNFGKVPISYSRHSEWVTGICYGPGVFGCLWLLLVPHLTIPAVLGMAAYSALAVSVLLAHQPRQVLTDSIAGKRSFAVRYGAKKAQTVSKGLMMTSLLALSFALLLSPAIWITKVLFLGAALYVLFETKKRSPSPAWNLLSSTFCAGTALIAEIVARGVLA